LGPIADRGAKERNVPQSHLKRRFKVAAYSELVPE